MNNYKGFTITVLHPTGMFEYYSTTQHRFLKFDELNDCYDSIDCEVENIALDEYNEETKE